MKMKEEKSVKREGKNKKRQQKTREREREKKGHPGPKYQQR